MSIQRLVLRTHRTSPIGERDSHICQMLKHRNMRSKATVSMLKAVSSITSFNNFSLFKNRLPTYAAYDIGIDGIT